MIQLKQGQIWKGGCVIEIYENPLRFRFNDMRDGLDINLIVDIDGFTQYLNQSFKLDESYIVTEILSRYEDRR